jgi:hypothetical protein
VPPSLAVKKTKVVESGGAAATTPNYAIFGFTAAGIPIYIYHFILHADFESNFILYGLVSVASGFLLSKANSNAARKLRPQLKEALEGPMRAKLSKQKFEGLNDKQKSEKIRDTIAATAATEAMYTVIFRNNATFMLALLACIFYFFNTFSTWVSYTLSVAGSAGVTYLLTTEESSAKWGEKKE